MISDKLKPEEPDNSKFEELKTTGKKIGCLLYDHAKGEMPENTSLFLAVKPEIDDVIHIRWIATDYPDQASLKSNKPLSEDWFFLGKFSFFRQFLLEKDFNNFNLRLIVWPQKDLAKNLRTTRSTACRGHCRV